MQSLFVAPNECTELWIVPVSEATSIKTCKQTTKHHQGRRLPKVPLRSWWFDRIKDSRPTAMSNVLIGTKIFMTHAVNSKASWEQRQPNTFVLMYQHHTCHCLWYDLAMKATQLDWLAWEHCFCRENKIRVNRLLWITSIQIRHTVAG